MGWDFTSFFCPGMEPNYWLLGITLAVAIVIGILDYVIPAKGTKFLAEVNMEFGEQILA